MLVHQRVVIHPCMASPLITKKPQVVPSNIIFARGDLKLVCVLQLPISFGVSWISDILQCEAPQL